MGTFASRVSWLALAACLTLLAVHAQSEDLGFRVTGNLVGVVTDPEGAPAIGANVQLFNKFQRLLAKTTVDWTGAFEFPDLPVDVYSVRISAGSYLPVSRDRILVRPGTDSLLQVHLATLLSSVHLTYQAPVAGMSNDWKWVLRSSPETRSILRFAAKEKAGKRPQGSESGQLSRVFSDTRAVLSISGGDANGLNSDSMLSDLGTGFLVSTNVIGKNRVQVAGSYSGYSPGANGPGMSLAARYTRPTDRVWGPSAPELSFSVSQFSILPGQPNAEGTPATPQVRTMSTSLYQAMDVGSLLRLEYGAVAESVDFIQHSSRVSPFARVSYSAGKYGELLGSFSDGDRPQELLRHQPRENGMSVFEGSTAAFAEVAPLASLPEVSYKNGRLELQRTHSFELGYRLDAGSKTFALSAFTDRVSNGRVHLAGDLTSLSATDLLSDGSSNTSVYDVGSYHRSGALLSMDQHLGDSADLTVAYGRIGGVMPGPAWDNVSEGQLLVDSHAHQVASINLSGRLPKAATHFFTSYGWTDRNAILPQHVFTTQNAYVSPGLNLAFKQPLPQFFGIPGHLLLTADVKNLLAQGYIPVSTPDGQRVLLVQSPRTIRGGLNFVF